MKIKKINKKILYIVLPILILLLFFGMYQLINFIRIKTAKIDVSLVDNLNVEFNSDTKVSDYINSINGNIINDYKIDTTKLGEKEIEFKFKNEDNIQVPYKFKINIVDTTAPLIWLNSTYSIAKDSNISLVDKILCGDNYDSKPKCFIEGDYDLTTVGEYKLVYKAIDSSKNESEQPFILKVYEENKTKNINEEVVENYTDFQEIVHNYKNDKTKIGIDISKWQKDIDFQKLKDAGVEFVMIRVGGTRGKGGEYFVDEKFKQNIKNANKYKIKAGIYFYSYASSTKEARNDAKWVLKQIKKYKIDLPIAFDWEEWGNFNEYNLSFFGLTSMAESFVKTVEDKGYKGMIYSSKSYLENIWLPTKYDIWLAHYTKNTNYEGKYKMWQICANGKVDGIDTLVDIDIWYE